MTHHRALAMTLFVLLAAGAPDVLARDKAFNLGKKFGEMARVIDSGVQRGFDSNPALRRATTGALNDVSDFVVGAVEPSADPEIRALVRDAVNMGMNPSETEQNAAMERLQARIRRMVGDDNAPGGDGGSRSSEEERPIPSHAQTPNTPPRFWPGSSPAGPPRDEALSCELDSLGVQAYHAGRIDDAVTYYLAAIRVDDSNDAAYSNLALAYVKKQQYEKAIWAGNLAVIHGKTTQMIGNAMHNLAMAYEKLGQREMAAAYYVGSLRNKPVGSGSYAITRKRLDALLARAR